MSKKHLGDAFRVGPGVEFVITVDDELLRPEVRYDERRNTSITSVFVDTSEVVRLRSEWAGRFERDRGSPRETQTWFLIYHRQMLREFKHWAARVGSEPVTDVMPPLAHPVTESLKRDFVRLIDHYVEHFRSRVRDYSQPMLELDSNDPLTLVETSNRALAQFGQPASAEEELAVLMSTIEPTMATHLYLALLRPQAIPQL